MTGTVLLVEDNEVNADMLSRRLTRRGYQVVIAACGLTALSLAEAVHPDVVLMDIDLPDIDGFETTRRLKMQPSTQAIPVVALTAHALVEDRAASLRAGCDAFETKPIDLARLLETIRTVRTRGDYPLPHTLPHP